jgi:hypothetical protein
MNEYYMAHIGEDKCMDDPHAHWLMSSNKWIYILGMFCEDELQVSKESDSLTKNKKGIIQREVGNSLKLKCKASCDYWKRT